MAQAVIERTRSRAAACRTRETAGVRSTAYALFSQLVASPHDGGDVSLALPPEDLGAVLTDLTGALPYEIEFSKLAETASRLSVGDEGRLARSYSALFEVGSAGSPGSPGSDAATGLGGPPASLREGLAGGRPAKAREEVVRYYSFFGYRLNEERQWQPDHLAIELEFLHYLAFREAHRQDREDALSYQLAELDFLARHPLDWYPAVGRSVARLAEEPYHLALFESLGDFLQRDHAWQDQSLED